MKVSSLLKNFDALYLDAKNSSLSLYDIDKMVEAKLLNKIVVINWNKNFISSNIKILSRIMSKISVSFSLIGVGISDVNEMKKLTSRLLLNTSVATFDINQQISLPPWIVNKEGLLRWKPVVGNVSTFFSQIAASTNTSLKHFLITASKNNGIFESRISSIESISGVDEYIISSYASYLRSKGIIPIMTVSINDTNELNDSYIRLASKLKSLGIDSILLVFKNSIEKKNLTYEEYENLMNVRKLLNLYIYGLPFDRFGQAEDDLDRFKWVVDVNIINKIAINIDQFNKNNLYYL